MKHRFIDFTKVVFEDVRKADYESQAPFAYLKHHFRDFVQIAFSVPRMKKIRSIGLSTS
jgi:hypothetical protein